MKLLAFGLILICCNAQEMRINEKYGNKLVEDFLIKFKEVLRTGNDTLGIPKCDPFNADEIKINVHEDQIKVNANLTKVNVNGLSEYDVINGDFKLGGNLALILPLSWPLVVASINYAIKGKADVFEIYGNGEINLSAHDFAFDVEINFVLDGEYLKVKGITLKLSLRKLEFKATGLYNDEELSTILSALISDMAPDLIGDETIISKVIELVTNLLDKFLSDITLSEILKMIFG
ncbi:PREDICTED: uncharacterized protein LOC105456758 [Wasmannia auropunctata]|uniref:uncharacterized protein LOC105456758 n=1 Tax=Wasmannia auropunctata TaxID=64793 RepID=UPI0005F0454D|nr:PREDICTED: uncharacterized protein LOC105456758 [Wasmannia auropunctata]XP_011699341.1 PREDICTED: uncharacterized protein LOC105456758 [Wasmannia auropunctata]XP_011699342.1 PREDICTED: uncharacterized protein LOC105456758 [Wasmannia auropunctata]XP_011699343.1 PREDICTED: uncharacterized protein LOC105456758 [Wasmannia auropunctata]